MSSSNADAYGKANLGLVAKLLVLWFVVLIFVYVRRMNQIDRQFGVEE